MSENRETHNKPLHRPMDKGRHLKEGKQQGGREKSANGAGADGDAMRRAQSGQQKTAPDGAAKHLGNKIDDAEMMEMEDMKRDD